MSKTTSTPAATAVKSTFDVILEDVVNSSTDTHTPIRTLGTPPRVRALGPDHLEKGDVFIIHADACFLDSKVSTTENPCYYFLVQMIDPKTKQPTNKTKRLYLTAFGRTIYEYAKDENTGELLTTKKYFTSSGSVVDLIQQHTAWDADLIDALDSKMVKVTNITPVTTRNYVKKDKDGKPTEPYKLIVRNVHQFDFVK